MFDTSRDELVRKVGIYFNHKYLVLTSAERELKSINESKHHVMHVNTG